jgi:predicted deacetylase
MGVSYIVRFDDICPTMNWRVWDRVEAVLDRYGVRPILAVVPDNRDPNLVVESARVDFWSRVRRWQAAGWTIALHGYQHIYTTRNAGLVGINDFSEFAGLAEDVQREKLTRALQIFEQEGVHADVWVAPAHSFDALTVSLLIEAGINVISDGFYYRLVRHLGALWVPQQLWRFGSMPAGLWTVCYHHNHFDETAVARLTDDIATHADRIVGVPGVSAAEDAPQLSAVDRAFSSAWLTALKLRRLRVSA